MSARAERRIGTAGWTIPARFASAFPREGSQLERYAARFDAVEINSSFYRPHRPATYARWAASVQAGFRFAVKVPKEISHTRKLAGAEPVLAPFLDEVGHLGGRLGPLLVQLPPSLAFEPGVAAEFFDLLRSRFAGLVACEPRHPSWFEPEAEALLAARRIARVAADPARVPCAAEPGGWDGFAYYRLHGSPRMYFSEYGPAYLDQLASRLAYHAGPVWCIFDNTGSGAAAGDAIGLLARCG